MAQKKISILDIPLPGVEEAFKNIDEKSKTISFTPLPPVVGAEVSAYPDPNLPPVTSGHQRLFGENADPFAGNTWSDIKNVGLGLVDIVGTHIPQAFANVAVDARKAQQEQAAQQGIYAPDSGVGTAGRAINELARAGKAFAQGIQGTNEEQFRNLGAGGTLVRAINTDAGAAVDLNKPLSGWEKVGSFAADVFLDPTTYLPGISMLSLGKEAALIINLSKRLGVSKRITAGIVYAAFTGPETYIRSKASMHPENALEESAYGVGFGMALGLLTGGKLKVPPSVTKDSPEANKYINRAARFIADRNSKLTDNPETVEFYNGIIRNIDKPNHRAALITNLETIANDTTLQKKDLRDIATDILAKVNDPTKTVADLDLIQAHDSIMAKLDDLATKRPKSADVLRAKIQALDTALIKGSKKVETTKAATTTTPLPSTQNPLDQSSVVRLTGEEALGRQQAMGKYQDLLDDPFVDPVTKQEADLYLKIAKKDPERTAEDILDEVQSVLAERRERLGIPAEPIDAGDFEGLIHPETGERIKPQDITTTKATKQDVDELFKDILVLKNPKLSEKAAALHSTLDINPSQQDFNYVFKELRAMLPEDYIQPSKRKIQTIADTGLREDQVDVHPLSGNLVRAYDGADLEDLARYSGLTDEEIAQGGLATAKLPPTPVAKPTKAPEPLPPTKTTNIKPEPSKPVGSIASTTKGKGKDKTKPVPTEPKVEPAKEQTPTSTPTLKEEVTTTPTVLEQLSKTAQKHKDLMVNTAKRLGITEQEVTSIYSGIRVKDRKATAYGNLPHPNNLSIDQARTLLKGGNVKLESPKSKAPSKSQPQPKKPTPLPPVQTVTKTVVEATPPAAAKGGVAVSKPINKVERVATYVASEVAKEKDKVFVGPTLPSEKKLDGGLLSLPKSRRTIVAEPLPPGTQKLSNFISEHVGESKSPTKATVKKAINEAVDAASLTEAQLGDIKSVIANVFDEKMPEVTIHNVKKLLNIFEKENATTALREKRIAQALESENVIEYTRNTLDTLRKILPDREINTVWDVVDLLLPKYKYGPGQRGTVEVKYDIWHWGTGSPAKHQKFLSHQPPKNINDPKGWGTWLNPFRKFKAHGDPNEMYAAWIFDQPYPAFDAKGTTNTWDSAVAIANASKANLYNKAWVQKQIGNQYLNKVTELIVDKEKPTLNEKFVQDIINYGGYKFGDRWLSFARDTFEPIVLDAPKQSHAETYKIIQLLRDTAPAPLKELFADVEAIMDSPLSLGKKVRDELNLAFYLHKHSGQGTNSIVRDIAAVAGETVDGRLTGLPTRVSKWALADSLQDSLIGLSKAEKYPANILYDRTMAILDYYSKLPTARRIPDADVFVRNCKEALQKYNDVVRATKGNPSPEQIKKFIKEQAAKFELEVNMMTDATSLINSKGEWVGTVKDFLKLKALDNSQALKGRNLFNQVEPKYSYEKLYQLFKPDRFKNKDFPAKVALWYDKTLEKIKGKSDEEALAIIKAELSGEARVRSLRRALPLAEENARFVDKNGKFIGSVPEFITFANMVLSSSKFPKFLKTGLQNDLSTIRAVLSGKVTHFTEALTPIDKPSRWQKKQREGLVFTRYQYLQRVGPTELQHVLTRLQENLGKAIATKPWTKTESILSPYITLREQLLPADAKFGELTAQLRWVTDRIDVLQAKPKKTAAVKEEILKLLDEKKNLDIRLTQDSAEVIDLQAKLLKLRKESWAKRTPDEDARFGPARFLMELVSKVDAEVMFSKVANWSTYAEEHSAEFQVFAQEIKASLVELSKRSTLPHLTAYIDNLAKKIPDTTADYTNMPYIDELRDSMSGLFHRINLVKTVTNLKKNPEQLKVILVDELQYFPEILKKYNITPATAEETAKGIGESIYTQLVKKMDVNYDEYLKDYIRHQVDSVDFGLITTADELPDLADRLANHGIPDEPAAAELFTEIYKGVEVGLHNLNVSTSYDSVQPLYLAIRKGLDDFKSKNFDMPQGMVDHIDRLTIELQKVIDAHVTRSNTAYIKNKKSLNLDDLTENMQEVTNDMLTRLTGNDFIPRAIDILDEFKAVVTKEYIGTEPYHVVQAGHDGFTPSAKLTKAMYEITQECMSGGKITLPRNSKEFLEIGDEIFNELGVELHGQDRKKLLLDAYANLRKIVDNGDEDLIYMHSGIPITPKAVKYVLDKAVQLIRDIVSIGKAGIELFRFNKYQYKLDDYADLAMQTWQKAETVLSRGEWEQDILLRFGSGIFDKLDANEMDEAFNMAMDVYKLAHTNRLAPETVQRIVKFFYNEQTRPLFRSAMEVSTEKGMGSLSEKYMWMLPDDLRNKIKYWDRKIGQLKTQAELYKQQEHQAISAVINGTVVTPKQHKFLLEQWQRDIDDTITYYIGERNKEIANVKKALTKYSLGGTEEVTSVTITRADGTDVHIPTARLLQEEIYFPAETTQLYNSNNLLGYVVDHLGHKGFFQSQRMLTVRDLAQLRQPLRTGEYWFGWQNAKFTEPVMGVVRNAKRLYDNFTKDHERKLLTIIPSDKLRDTNFMARVQSFLHSGIYQRYNKPPVDQEAYQVALQLADEFYRPVFKQLGLDANILLDDVPNLFFGRQTDALITHYCAKKNLTEYDIPDALKAMRKLYPANPVDTLNTLDFAKTFLRTGFRGKIFYPVVDKHMDIMQLMSEDRASAFKQMILEMQGEPRVEEVAFNKAVNGIVRDIKQIFGKEHIPRRYGMEWTTAITQAIYNATLLGNLKSAVTNLTQVMLAMTTLDANPAVGAKYYAKATKLQLDALKSPAARAQLDAILDLNWVAQDRVFQEGLEQRAVLAEAGFLGKAWGTAKEYGYKPFSMADEYNVHTSFLMKYLYELDNTRSFGDAIREANKFAGDTQFRYGIDSPTFYKNPLGKVFGVLTSYPVNYINFLAHTATKDPNVRRGMGKAFASIAAMTLLPVVMNRSGWDFSNISPEQTLTSFGVVGLFTDNRISVPWATVRDVAGWMSAVREGDVKNQKKYANAILKTDCVNFLPFGLAAKKLVKGWEILQHPTPEGNYKVYDAYGKLDFEMTPGELARSVVGGTIEGGQRYRQKQLDTLVTNRLTTMRQEAIEAAIEGDMNKFFSINREIVAAGGTPVSPATLRQMAIDRAMTYEERKNLKPQTRGKKTWTDKLFNY